MGDQAGVDPLDVDTRRKAIARGIKALKTRFTIKRLTRCGNECLDLRSNALFEFFGKSRYERVVHEFLISVLDHPKLTPAARDTIGALIEPMGWTLEESDILLVHAEKPRRGVRVDIIVSNVDQAWELAFELKVGASVTESQSDGYRTWLGNSSNRRVIVIGAAAKTLAARNAERVGQYRWPEFADLLERSLFRKTQQCRVAKHRMAKHRMDFLRDFVKGLRMMDADYKTYTNLQLYLHDDLQASFMDLACVVDDFARFRRLGVDCDAVDAAEKTAWLAEQEATRIIDIAAGVFRDKCKGSLPDKALPPKKKKKRTWELEFPVRGRRTKSTTSRLTARIGTTLCLDVRGKPALLMWAWWPDHDRFDHFTRTFGSAHREARELWGKENRRWILGRVCLRKKGAGGFKDEEVIRRELSILIDDKLLQRSKGLLMRLANAATPK